MGRAADSADSSVDQQFELQDHGAVNGRLARLGITRRAVGGAFEMPVAEAAAPAAKQFHFLTVVVHFAEELAGFGVEHHGARRHLYHGIIAVLTEAAAAASALAVTGKHVAVVFQRQQCPHLFVAAQYHVTAATAVAAVGSAFRHIFGAVEMTRSGAALARAAMYLHVVDEI